MFSCHSESSHNTFSGRDRSNELGNRFESAVGSVFKFADPANVRKSLDGNKDHLLNYARSELMTKKHQVGSLNSCIDELHQQACAQRLGLEDAHHGYIESGREHFRLQEGLSMKEKSFEQHRYEIYTRCEKCKELKNCAPFLIFISCDKSSCTNMHWNRSYITWCHGMVNSLIMILGRINCRKRFLEVQTYSMCQLASVCRALA